MQTAQSKQPRSGNVFLQERQFIYMTHYFFLIQSVQINTLPSLGSYDNLDVFHIAQATQTTAVFWNFANCRKDCIETLKQARK
ncbi:hypothetical protein T10_4507 [Trichinella papuae]|uniref:Uncharacterized protein n=1 Tax=Trichinella papuae TaxID=268474 RepID=A0A0V1MNE8_9BILA|nr:hypothetical protein T10_4507 [Trichinella papuae]